jgi:hypothetical protein
MPYSLRKVPKKDLYWVVNKETGKKHSKEGLPKEKAEAQRRALYAAESGYKLKGGITVKQLGEIIQRSIDIGDTKYGKRPDGRVDKATLIHSDTTFRKLVSRIYAKLTDEQRNLEGVGEAYDYLMDPSTEKEADDLTEFMNHIFENAPEDEDKPKKTRSRPPDRQRKGFAEREAEREQREAEEAERVAREAEQAAEAARALADREAAEAEAAREAARLPSIRVPREAAPVPQGSPTSPLSPTAAPARVITQEELEAMRSRTQPKTGKGKRGGGIEMKLLQEMAQSAYRGKTKLQIGPFKLLTSTPTLKFYKDDSPKRIIVSVRGTELSDTVDLAADALAVIGKLRTSERWKKDEAKLREVQAKFSPKEYRYIAVGHSLGGAIVDLMLRDRLVQTALSYNPLVEPQELGGNPKHRRIYHKNDPLYQTFGRFIPNVEVRTTAEPFWKYFLEYNLPFNLGELFKLYDRHRIGRFKGGSMKGGMTFNDFRRWWATPLSNADRERLALTGQYDESAMTRGDAVITSLATLLGWGATGYGLSVYDRSEDNTGVHPASAPIALAGFVGSPFVGPLINKLTRLLPMPPTEQQERELADARRTEAERTRDIAVIVNPMNEAERTAQRIDTAQRRAEQLERLRVHSRVGAIPNMPMAEFVGPERREAARAAAEAELEEEVENPLRRAQRVEFAPQMIGDVGNDRDGDGEQDEREYTTGGARELVFEDQLQELEYDPKKYLSKAKANAKKAGYDPKQLSFCVDGTHKLQMKTPDGKLEKFGRVGYGDFLIWSFLERNGKVEKGEAKKRRKAYLKRASAIEGDWKENKYSANNLAMKILWK